MFGIFLAAICAIGLYKVWRPMRFGRIGCGGGRLFRELNATPEQAAALRESAQELRMLRSIKNSRRMMTPIAEALTGPAFDKELWWGQMRAAAEETARPTIESVIERLRATLDPEQRAKLVAMGTRRFGKGEKA